MGDTCVGFELFETVDAFILKGRQSCLWCNRLDGRLVVRSLSEFKNAWEPVSLGIVYGCVGKIRLLSDGEWRLLVINNRTSVGNNVNGQPLYRINKVVAVSMAPDDASDLELDVNDPAQLVNQKSRLKRLSNPRHKAFLQTLSTYRASQTMKPKKEQRELDKVEKRLLEELLKMFSSESFFFCPTDDLTNTVQRASSPSYNADLPLWQRADDRFFWNKHMLSDLLKLEGTEGVDEWILPIIQGHVELHMCSLKDSDSSATVNPALSDLTSRQNAVATLSRIARRSAWRETRGDSTQSQVTDDSRTHQAADFDENSSFKLYVISRRSRHRAGTRFLRRGADESGAAANYVETEQIVVVKQHIISFIQIRGSIPVYWSQLGLKYRPPPKLDRSEGESQKVFKSHFDEQLQLYDRVTVINLVEQQGREKIMADAYMKHMDLLNDFNTVYITFDFHEHCKGMHFENVENLVDALDVIIRNDRYCWRDGNGILCQQVGVLRINCMDCLDRTNVVMAAMARRVLLTTLFKLGLLSPDSTLPSDTRGLFQSMWANNGDAISRQYAGTAALKGDFTRTGERSMMGVMKDGYNSASRYYVNHFRDVYRQTVIDLMLGNPISEDLLHLERGDESTDLGTEADEWTMEREESVAYSIKKCQQLLVTSESTSQGWAVVEHGPCSGLMDGNDDNDLILLLIESAVIVAMYDYECDDVLQYETISLEELHSLQLGVIGSFGKSSPTVYLRVLRREKGESGFFYTFRPVHSCSPAEAKESLLGLVDAIQSCRSKAGLATLPYHETKLSKNRSKRPSGLVVLSQSLMKQSWSWKPRRNEPTSSDDKIKKKASRFLNINLGALRRSSPGSTPCGSDSEDNEETTTTTTTTTTTVTGTSTEGMSPRLMLKAEGRRVMMNMKRFIRPDSFPLAKEESDSDGERCSAGAPTTQSSARVARSCSTGDVPDTGPSMGVHYMSNNGGEAVTRERGSAVAEPRRNKASHSSIDIPGSRANRFRRAQVGKAEEVMARRVSLRLSSPPPASSPDSSGASSPVAGNRPAPSSSVPVGLLADKVSPPHPRPAASAPFSSSLHTG